MVSDTTFQVGVVISTHFAPRPRESVEPRSQMQLREEIFTLREAVPACLNYQRLKPLESAPLQALLLEVLFKYVTSVMFC